MICLFNIPAIFLLIGLADLPIGYYTFLRIIVFIASFLLSLKTYNDKNKLSCWTILFAITAILFNPLIPVYLNDKEIWSILDVIVAVIFIINGVLHTRSRNSINKENLSNDEN